MKYRSYTLKNYKQIRQVERLDRKQLFDIDVVGGVLPFKTNNYVVDELIRWDEFEDDPMFILNFPQKGMLVPEHFERVAALKREGAPDSGVTDAIRKIRGELNPNPAGQMDNVPLLNGSRVEGIQHKYREIMLFFPRQGQTCHAYCTFCFRWPQFAGGGEYRFAANQADTLVAYIKANPDLTDVLITGGDPLVMSAKKLSVYVDALLDANIPHIRNIRFGTKTLSFWPYRYLTDRDSGELLDIFRRITDRGYHLSVMAHVNHPRELSTDAFKAAVSAIRATGAVIRTQSPVLNNINAASGIWSEMWEKQVALGIIPYYMFIARNTGAQPYFAVPLVRAYEIYRDAVSRVSGLARSARGPSMSAFPGKVKIDGVSEIAGEKVLVMSMIQGRDEAWVRKPFFARYDEAAVWLDDLKPAFGEEKFFFERKRGDKPRPAISRPKGVPLESGPARGLPFIQGEPGNGALPGTRCI